MREMINLFSVEICPLCGGYGWRLRSRACAEDDPPNPNDPGDYIPCGVCKRVGWIHRTDEKEMTKSA